jgi:TetR/AcrR family transcriptional regulator, cholesterol catabolism regulator
MFLSLPPMNEKLVPILENVKSIFMRYGIKSVTMDDLCREMGISKKTLYQFVSDKNDLVKKAMSQEICSDQLSINSILDKKLGAIDELIEITRLVGEKLKNLHPSILYDMQKYYPEAWEVMSKHRNGYIVQTIRENIEKGQKEGVFRPDVKSQIIALLFASKIELFADTSMYSNLGLTAAEIYSENLTYHIRGIANAEGIKQLEEKFSSTNPTPYEK